MRRVVRPRNKLQTAAGASAQGAMLFKTSLLLLRAGQSARRCKKYKNKKNVRPLSKFSAAADLSVGRAQTVAPPRPFYKPFGTFFGRVACKQTPADVLFCHEFEQTLEVEKKWERRGLFNPP